MKSVLQKIVFGYLYPSCAVFTLVLLAFTAIESAVTSISTPAITLEKIMIILVFSLLIGLADLILKIKKMNGVVKVLLHFTACAAAFILTFIVWAGYTDSFTAVFMLLVAFVAVYIVVTAIYLLVRSVTKRAEKEREDYKKQF